MALLVQISGLNYKTTNQEQDLQTLCLTRPGSRSPGPARFTRGSRLTFIAWETPQGGEGSLPSPLSETPCYKPVCSHEIFKSTAKIVWKGSASELTNQKEAKNCYLSHLISLLTHR